MSSSGSTGTAPFPNLLHRVMWEITAWVREGKIPAASDSREHFIWIMGLPPTYQYDELDWVKVTPEQRALAQKLLGPNGFTIYKALLARKTEGVDE